MQTPHRDQGRAFDPLFWTRDIRVLARYAVG